MQCFETTREVGNVRILLYDTLESEIAEKLGPSAFGNSNLTLLKSKSFENNVVFFIGTTNHLQTGFLLPLQAKMDAANKLLNVELKQLLKRLKPLLKDIQQLLNLLVFKLRY